MSGPLPHVAANYFFPRVSHWRWLAFVWLRLNFGRVVTTTAIAVLHLRLIRLWRVVISQSVIDATADDTSILLRHRLEMDAAELWIVDDVSQRQIEIVFRDRIAAHPREE